jgi:hypothetical protein
MDATVYACRCIPTGKAYIGAAKHFGPRKRQHLQALDGGYHYNQYLQAAFNRWGEGAFRFEVLETCQPGHHYEREAYWIEHFNTLDPQYGFNASTPGTRACRRTADWRLFVEALTDEDVQAILDCDWLTAAEIAEEVRCSEHFIKHIIQISSPEISDGRAYGHHYLLDVQKPYRAPFNGVRCAMAMILTSRDRA